MTFYQELQLSSTGSKQLIKNTTDKKEKRRGRYARRTGSERCRKREGRERRETLRRARKKEVFISCCGRCSRLFPY